MFHLAPVISSVISIVSTEHLVSSRVRVVEDEDFSFSGLIFGTNGDDVMNGTNGAQVANLNMQI